MSKNQTFDEAVSRIHRRKLIKSAFELLLSVSVLLGAIALLRG